MKRVLLPVTVLLLLAGVAGGALWWQFQRFLETPLELPADGHSFNLAPGSHGADIVTELASLGFTRAGWEWKLLMRLEPQVYRSGEYWLEAGLKPRELLREFAGGWVVQHRVTLIEGWTFRQVVAALGEHPVLEQNLDMTHPSQWPEQLAGLGIEHPEGWFLPETYAFTRGDSDLDILGRAHRAMREALALAWASRDEQLPLETPYELLILASIIEKETSLEEEREQIAGVFVRRLRKGMKLQTDPTVIYGIGASFDGDIRRRDLRTDTPYNTYTRHGLPPTPIAMPGRASLLAAAHPAPGDALFFVANGEGGHTFSATLEEHQSAVNKLLGKQ
jgi:UPF0755 protein